MTYEGKAIAPSTIMASLRDLLEERDCEPIQGKAWTSPQFMHPEAGSLWAAWWALTDPERTMIRDLYPRLFTALYLLIAPLENRERWLADRVTDIERSGSVTPGDIAAVEHARKVVEAQLEVAKDHHFYNCPARLRNVPCNCSEDNYRKMLAGVKIEYQDKETR